MVTLSSWECLAQETDTARFLKVGKQTWMVRNLDVGSFRNGQSITEARTPKEWKNASDNGIPAWCYYNNDPSNANEHGRLYNWYAVHDPRGLAPKGWRIPHDEEWENLVNSLGGPENAGTAMKSEQGWSSYNEAQGNGKNSSGFTGLPGGGRGSKGEFGFLGYNGFWWTLVNDETTDAWYYFLSCEEGNVKRFSSYSRGVGYSVRCIKE